MTVQITIGEIQKIGTQMLDELNRICLRNNIKYFVHAGSALGAVRHGGPIPWDFDIDAVFEFPALSKLLECLRRELSDKFLVNFYDATPNYDRLFPRIGLANSPYDAVYLDLFPLVGLPNNCEQQVLFSKKSGRINYLYKFQYKDVSSMRGLGIRKCAGKLLKNALRLLPQKFYITQFENHCRKYPYENARYVMNPCGGYGTKNIFAKSVFDERVWVNYAGLTVPIPKDYDYYLKQYYQDYMKYPPIEQRKKGLAKTTTISKEDYERFNFEL